VLAFFGKLLGLGSFRSAACAVAYVGFAGTLPPGSGGADVPIELCLQSIQVGTGCSCDKGQWQPSTTENQRWTDLTQVQSDSNCPAVADSTTQDKVAETQMCYAASVATNDPSLYLNQPLYTQDLILGQTLVDTNGTQDNSISSLYTCWKNDPVAYSTGVVNTSVGPNQPVKIKMPLIDCGGTNNGACNSVIGAIGVHLLWVVSQASKITTPGNVPSSYVAVDNYGPWTYNGTDCSTLSGQTQQACYLNQWNKFTDHYGLTNAPYADKTIYFMPLCKPVELGGTGGGNFGDRAALPVLVY